MPTINLTSQFARFTPAAVGTYERKLLFRVNRGDRVLWADAMKVVLADAGTLSSMVLGDVDDEDGYITADLHHLQAAELDDAPYPFTGDLDLESDYVRGLVDGTGAYLQKSGGKLYAEAAGIYAIYDPGSVSADYGATVPVVDFHIGIVRRSVPGGAAVVAST